MASATNMTEERKKRIKKLLADGKKRTSPEISKELGIPERTTRRLLQKMREAGEIAYTEETDKGLKRFLYFIPVAEGKKETKEKEDGPKVEKTQKTAPRANKLILKINGVKILEAEVKGDIVEESQKIVHQHFGKNIKYDIAQENGAYIVDIKLDFRTKGKLEGEPDA